MPVVPAERLLRSRSRSLSEAAQTIARQQDLIREAFDLPTDWPMISPWSLASLKRAQALIDLNDRVLTKLAMLSPSSPLPATAHHATGAEKKGKLP